MPFHRENCRRPRPVSPPPSLPARLPDEPVPPPAEHSATSANGRWTERLRRGSITAEARPNTRATTTPSHTHVDLHRPLRRLSCSCAHPARTHTAVGQTPDLSALSFALASVPPVASWLLLWLAPTLRRF